LQALEANLATGSEFDRTKVEAIKQAIREGRLAVNSEVIADRMLVHAMALLGKDK
jgi:flagellar biosynthesis anti-sigma factor FlgM